MGLRCSPSESPVSLFEGSGPALLLPKVLLALSDGRIVRSLSEASTSPSMSCESPFATEEYV